VCQRLTRLSTANLILRDFVPSDLGAYLALRMEPKVLRFSSEEESTPEKAAQLLQLFIEQASAIPRTKYQLAITLQDGTLIGSCGVRIEAPGAASIGCEVGRQWHGRGAAREAGLAMLAFGFSELQLDKVYAETIPENLAALRLCRTLGLRLAHTLPAHHHFKGRSWASAVYELTRAEWRATSVAGTRQ
jgi:ribosomal-protein-alanine N-acetyltransferase